MFDPATTLLKAVAPDGFSTRLNWALKLPKMSGPETVAVLSATRLFAKSSYLPFV